MKVVFQQFTTILEPVMPWTSWTDTPYVHHILSQTSTALPSLAKFYVGLIVEINYFPHSKTFYLMHSLLEPKSS
jgi:hypothetical protein